MIRLALVFILTIGFSGLSAQTDLSKWVNPVYDGEESTALSIFDTNPESPDGKYLAFIKYKEIVKGGHAGPPTEAFLMVKNDVSK